MSFGKHSYRMVEVVGGRGELSLIDSDSLSFTGRYRTHNAVLTQRVTGSGTRTRLPGGAIKLVFALRACRPRYGANEITKQLHKHGAAKLAQEGAMHAEDLEGGADSHTKQ
jgi:hypothetical protein